MVETSSGRLAGRETEDGLEFLGVPYAVAERFAPPADAARWAGVRDATRVGPAAPQPDREVCAFTHGELPGADERHSLVLNVFTPALDGARPVLVWLHGGGFAIGHGGGEPVPRRRAGERRRCGGGHAQLSARESRLARASGSGWECGRPGRQLGAA